jgi:hypothetical protein
MMGVIRAYRKHWTASFPDHPLRDAAKEKARNASAAMRTHHNQVGGQS